MGKHGLTVRGDSLYCPLPLSLEPYWWCEPNCPHCYFRGLNHVWGSEMRPIDIPSLERKLTAGMRNKNPKTPLAHCLAERKTIRVGNKTDPFQPAEEMYRRSTEAIELLCKLRWTFVIQTRFPSRAWDMNLDTLLGGIPTNRGLVTFLPIISPGAEMDWELLERKRTEPIPQRLATIQKIVQTGIDVGVNGEPFIPGFHTVDMFRDMLKRLKDVGVNRYNTYNFHFTAHVAKRLVAEVPEVDIEKVWEMNQDVNWKPILLQLLAVAEEMDMILGCPDFVNSGSQYKERANTCCGIDVANPCTFNTHYFKRLAQEGLSVEKILQATDDGSGDHEEAVKIITGTSTDMYNLKDAGVIPAGCKVCGERKKGFDL